MLDTSSLGDERRLVLVATCDGVHVEMGRVYDFNCQAHSNVNRILFVIGFLLQPTFEIYIYIYYV